ncbi:protoporphyrinogen oxidase [Nocardioides ochotonae]|uniref:protoporphyrinogen oxidase n=1 Tax=Nocardioides ochotonae TaxID=2685869 RepID=UPI00140789E0|nr:protoporphyrinogen oxidase [Nocardioides ochotonae]
MPSPTRVAVVGAGLAGLTAAHDLSARGCEVVVLESADRVGGKIRRTDVAGVTVDVGAEAMLHRRPEGFELARSLDLEVEHPAVVSSRIWTRGALRQLPRSLMGVPLDLDQLAASGVLSPEGLARVRREPTLPPEVLDEDVTVGDLVARRLGDEVVDRLVEPLLGGVYAGHARLISARAAVPQLVSLAQRGSLLELGAALPSDRDTPVFAGLPGGMGRLPETLAASLDVRLSTTVRALERTEDGLRLVTGPTTAPVALDVDAVVLATPAAPTARLLADLAPTAAADLAGIEYASMAVVSLAFRAADAAALEATGSSGFLVPPVDGRRIKASTFSFAKWGWVRRAGAAAEEPLVHLRTSLGRHREEAALQASDEELIAWSLADLAEATGFAATPVDAHVQRWGGGLPQYALGHVERVARIRAAVERVPGLAVCGAAYDGVGIPAVIASARTAVARLVPPGVPAESSAESAAG